MEELSATSSSLLCKVSRTYNKEGDLIVLLDKLALVTVQQITWQEVKSFFESTHGEDAAFNTHCAEAAARELDIGNLLLKKVEEAAEQLLNGPSWTRR